MATQDELKKYSSWVTEAQWVAREWRNESWRDCEMVDGGDAQWTTEDWEKAQAAGIDPLTINRTFPTVNLILGSQALNKFDVIAKARTQDDSEISQVMTEGLKFVMDQNDGEFKVSQVFRDQVVPGFGCLSPCLNPDPRQERLAIKYKDWKEVWWDPFAPPWFTPDNCRYVFTQKWMDLDDLIMMFPEKAKEIRNKYEDMSGASQYETIYDDLADRTEEEIRMLTGSRWAEGERERVRPAQMWYPVPEKALFALFADGRAVEIKQDMELMAQYQIISQAQEVLSAIVKKMKVITFFDDLELQDMYSPYPHDQYPLVPFVGYIDRWKFPYGVPRQIRGQDEEVNKRRSMALALLKTRRILIEKTAVGKDADRLMGVYDEVNKHDGFIVLDEGGLKKVLIDENADLTPSQIALLEQSEREIQEIAGTNIEQPYSKGDSGVAIKEKEKREFSITATLFDNLRRSLKMLGDQTVANIQGFWQHEKVLRITDRLTGAERFVALNERVQGNDGQIQVKNNITQGKYDLVVSEAPQTDTIREQNLNLIIEWVKKSPPEVIPQLMNLAFEMSNLPNKEQLLAKIKPLLGADPTEDDMSPEELKAKVQKELEAQQQQAAEMAQVEKMGIELELNKKRLENLEIQAKIKKLLADAEKTVADAGIDQDKIEIDREKVEIDAFKAGTDAGVKVIELKQGWRKYADDQVGQRSKAAGSQNS